MFGLDVDVFDVVGAPGHALGVGVKEGLDLFAGVADGEHFDDGSDEIFFVGGGFV